MPMLSHAEEMQGQEPTLASLWKDLLCPVCSCRLFPVSDSPNSLVCFTCSEKFPIVNGIPRLLTKTASRLSDSSNGVADRGQTLFGTPAILALPAIYRAPVVLRDLQGMSTEEASAVLHVKDQTLKSRLHRGRLILRRELADFAGGLSLHPMAA